MTKPVENATYFIFSENNNYATNNTASAIMASLIARSLCSGKREDSQEKVIDFHTGI